MRILNFGSLNIDHVYFLDHFVRPGETLSCGRLETHCGGKGLNQSIALARAGADVYHAGCIGRDGGMLRDTLAAAGADAGLILGTDTPSGNAVIQVDRSGQNCIILYPGANHRIDEGYIGSVLSRFGRGDHLLLQNEISGLPVILTKAKERGMTIALNPSPVTKELLSAPLHLVDTFILNEIEGAQISGEETPGAILDGMARRFPGSRIVLTLGKDGSACHDGGRRFSHGIYRVRAVDTTAAGDTFTGFFIAAAIAGRTVPEALEAASRASALAVMKAGAADSIPSLRDIEGEWPYEAAPAPDV